MPLGDADRAEGGKAGVGEASTDIFAKQVGRAPILRGIAFVKKRLTDGRERTQEVIADGHAARAEMGFTNAIGLAVLLRALIAYTHGGDADVATSADLPGGARRGATRWVVLARDDGEARFGGALLVLNRDGTTGHCKERRRKSEAHGGKSATKLD
jgi:hypothetical protein